MTGKWIENRIADLVKERDYLHEVISGLAESGSPDRVKQFEGIMDFIARDFPNSDKKIEMGLLNALYGQWMADLRVRHIAASEAISLTRRYFELMVGIRSKLDKLEINGKGIHSEWKDMFDSGVIDAEQFGILKELWFDFSNKTGLSAWEQLAIPQKRK